jgi:exodeoxyribonuclease V alpha subunit
MQHYNMLQRNLLYTGVTRAKKAVVLVGTVNAVSTAVKNNAVTKRNTGLAARLK